MLVAAMVSLSAFAQEFEPQTGVLQRVFTNPVLDGVADEGIYNFGYNDYDVAVWQGGNQVAGVVGEFSVSYTGDSLYIYSEVRLESTKQNGEHEIGITICLDQERGVYGWDEGEPDADGFLFSKTTFGGDHASATVPGESKVFRNVEWFYNEVEAEEVTIDGTPMLRDGYNVEARIAWKDISTDQALIDNFKADYLSGERSIYFDLGYKFVDGENENYVAWSNDDNSTWESTAKAGTLTLMERKTVEIPEAASAPALDAEKEDVYTGEGHDIVKWNAGGEGIADVSAKYWATYDSDYLYIYSEIVVPNAEKTADTDEVTITVGVRPTDAYLNFDAGAPNENGYLFSKLKFLGDKELSVYEDRGVEWMWRNAEAFDEFEGYICEGRVAWDGVATTDADMLAEFLVRESFFFDIGYKLKGENEFYFAWNNNDNMTWRSTFSTGRLYFEGALPVSVNNVKVASDLNIWPNPVDNALNFSSDETVESVQIFNLGGQQVLNAELNGGSTVDASALKGGIYVVKVNFVSGQSAITKILKQ